MRLFISYRSADFEAAQRLHDQLAVSVGDEQLTFDKRTFASGTVWLPQIYAGVAMCDVLLCAVGPGWVTQGFAADGGAVDYVREELRLAQRLGKPVLPVLMGVTADTMVARLPADLQWLSSLHFHVHDPLRGPLPLALLQAVASLGGPQPIDPGGRASWGIARGAAALARNLVASLVRPTAHAASALRPTWRGVQSSLVLMVAALALMAVPALLIGGEVPLGLLARFAALGALLALGTYACVSLLSGLARKQMPTLALASFSLHAAATYLIAIVMWAVIVWVVLPDEVLTRVMNPPDDGRPFLQLLEHTIKAMPMAAQLAFQGVNALMLLHLLVLTYAQWRAVTVSIGWLRRRQAWAACGLSAIAFVIAVPVLVRLQAWREADLPRPVHWVWLSDQVEAGGKSVLAPFRFALDGRLDKRGNDIVLLVDQFTAESRDQPDLLLQALRCSLGVLEAGQFRWPQPVPRGQAAIQNTLPRDGQLNMADRLIRMPLTADTRTGVTVVNCYVDAPTASYPLGSGQFEVLHW